MDNKVLMIEDDASLGESLKDYFELNDLSVMWATNGKEGIRLFEEFNPNLVLLDVVLPDMDGFEIANEIQKQNNLIPIIFMTGTAFDKEDYNKAYQSINAKNYMEKPINPYAALAQIKSILNPSNAIIYNMGDINIKIYSQELSINNHKILLQHKDIEIFSILFIQRNKIVNRNYIKTKVWKDDRTSLNNRLDSCINRIRKAIKEFNFIEINTIYGEGYSLTI